MDVWSHEDKIRNQHVRGSGKVAPVTKKTTEKRKQWYNHDKRRVSAKKNGACTSTGKDTERKTEN